MSYDFEREMGIEERLEHQEVAAAEQPDNCQVCHGAKGGVRGNEQLVNGVVLCDYCHAATMAAELPISNHPKFTQGTDSAVSGGTFSKHSRPLNSTDSASDDIGETMAREIRRNNERLRSLPHIRR